MCAGGVEGMCALGVEMGECALGVLRGMCVLGVEMGECALGVLRGCVRWGVEGDVYIAMCVHWGC